MKTFTFSEAQAMLGVDPKTFRKWVDKAGIDVTKQVSKLDERVRYLTEDQFNKIAKDHGKDTAVLAFKNDGTFPEFISQGKLKLIDERVDDLEARPYVDPVELEKRFNELEKRYEKLEHGYTQQLVQLTDALIAVKELRDWQQAQESKPKPGRKPKAQQGGVEEAQAD